MGQLKHSVDLSRRRFLKSASVATAAVALTGCSKGDGETIYLGGTTNSGDTDLVIPADEKIFSGTMGNNCGGKCVIRAHIQNGVVKRFTTDEYVEADGDEVTRPQKRACLKCRGKLSEIYKSDRLLYPLKQTRERGDITGFQRISWEQAFKEIAEKLKASLAKGYTGTDPYFNLPNNSSRYGKGTMFAPFGGGPTHALASYNFAMKLQKCVAGSIPTNPTAMSYPATNYIDKYTHNAGRMAIPIGGGMYMYIHQMLINEPNGRLDMFNCKHIILWGFNPADSIMDTNTMYLLIQAKEKGIPITVIDHQLTRTSTTLKAKHIAPVGGSDSALVFAILYHLIKKQLAETSGTGIMNGKWLDFDFIKKSCHGFFDLPNPTANDFYAAPSRQKPSDPSKYNVPAGASLSAYVLGTELDLVSANINDAPSIYPNTIGYNVNSAATSPDGIADALYSKRVPIYGQTPKTPEWAELITGVPANDIKELAENIALAKNVGIFTGWGSNRTLEGEQAVWAINTLAAIMGFWGENGKFWGSTHMSMSKPSELAAVPSFAVNTVSAGISAAAAAIENQIINYRRYNVAKMSFPTMTPQTATTQICAWTDMVMNGGTGKSLWNDPQTKYCPPIRSYIMAGGNPVNQTGDNKFSMSVMKNKDKLELAVSIDIFMSASAQYADYVLPGAMPFEMDSFTNTKTSFINVPKVANPPGEAMPDMHIFEGIAKNINPAYEVEMCGLKTGTEIVKDAFSKITTKDLTFEQFQAKGYLEYATKAAETAVNPVFKDYRTYINSDGASGTPLITTSGKFEIYSQGLVEDYESRRWYNFDDDAARYGLSAADMELKYIGQTFRIGGAAVDGIYTKSCEYTNNHLDIPTDANYDTFALIQGTAAEVATNKKKARFVYPIPMYIPLAEGCHACDSSNNYSLNGVDMRHPDPLGLRATYPLVSSNHHSIYHAHSCGDNNPYATEVYKLNGKGGSAFRNMERGKGTITAGQGLVPAAELGVYEPLNICSADASALKLKTGDIILVTSPRASALMAANVTNTMRSGVTVMTEGAWSSFLDCKITFADGTSSNISVDVAGSANSLAMQRPSRICQASAYGTYQRIKIQKVTSVELV